MLLNLIVFFLWENNNGYSWKDVKYEMKFRTKLVITFLTVILLPLVLSAIAFAAIGAFWMIPASATNWAVSST